MNAASSAGSWISSVVRPAFQQFAVGTSTVGFSAVVGTSELRCDIDLRARDGKGDHFHAALGIGAPGSQVIVATFPGTEAPFVVGFWQVLMKGRSYLLSKRPWPSGS